MKVYMLNFCPYLIAPACQAMMIFSLFFQCILRYPPPCRPKYTWIYLKITVNK